MSPRADRRSPLALDSELGFLVPGRLGGEGDLRRGETVVVTDAALDKVECHLAAQSAHDGLARAVVPAHTRFDGDAFVVAATGTTPDPDEIVAWSRQNMANYKAPKQVFVLDELPFNPGGKVMKFELRNRLQET